MPPIRQMKDPRIVNIYVNYPDWQFLKKHERKSGRSAAHWVREQMTKYVEEHKPN